MRLAIEGDLDGFARRNRRSVHIQQTLEKPYDANRGQGALPPIERGRAHP
jgi:hypothetical protein